VLLAGPRLLRLASGRISRLDPHRAGGWAVGDLYAAEVGFLLNGVAKGLAFAAFASAIQPGRAARSHGGANRRPGMHHA
jgi:hypothetical protein